MTYTECRTSMQQIGARRQRPFVPLGDIEPDRHEFSEATGKLLPYKDAQNVPMPGSVASSMPQWRRKPPYVVASDGTARMHFADDPRVEMGRWKLCFACDFRKNFVRQALFK